MSADEAEDEQWPDFLVFLDAVTEDDLERALAAARRMQERYPEFTVPILIIKVSAWLNLRAFTLGPRIRAWLARSFPMGY